MGVRLRTLLVLGLLAGRAWAQDPAPLESRLAPVSRAAPREWFELEVAPLLVQINGLYVMHVGSGGSLQVQLHERFGLVLAGAYNWVSQVSDFSYRLDDQFRLEVQQPRASVLTTWALGVGFEVRPFIGDLSFLRQGHGRVSFFLRGLAGVVGRQHELKPLTVRVDGSRSPPTYGDVEPGFAMSFGGGVRVELGAHVALRLELQDTLSPSVMRTIDGCGVDDVRAMDQMIRSGHDPGEASVHAGCDYTRFTGVVPGTDINRSNDVPLALNLLRIPSGEWQQNTQVSLGVSFTF